MSRPHEVIRAVARGETVVGSAVTRAVADSALEHRMAGLLLAAVSERSEIPRDVSIPLVALDLAVVVRRRDQDRVWGLLQEQLDGAGVVHTFIKGPVSALRWFDRPADRPYSDIDVVVPPGRHFVDAVALLDPENPAIEILLGSDDRGRISSVDVVVDGVSVDIQTDALRCGIPPSRGECWSVGTERLESGARILDPEHDLVMFLLHQARDRFRFLLGVAETERRLRSPIDWKRVEEIAREEGIWDQVAVALEVLCDELAMRSPIRPPSGWRTWLWRRLWRPHVRFLGEDGRGRHILRGRWLMPLTMRGRFLDAVGWIVGSAFPGESIIALRYPDMKGPYLWRVVMARARVIGRRRIWALKHRVRSPESR